MDNNDFKRFLGMKDYIEVDCFIEDDYFIDQGRKLIEGFKKRDNTFNTNTKKIINKLEPDKKYIHHFNNSDLKFDHNKGENKYSPMKNKDLFIKFTSIDTNNEDAILDFVKEFGYLESSLAYPLDKFKLEVEKAARLLKIYDLMMRNKLVELKKYMIKKEEDNFFYDLTWNIKKIYFKDQLPKNIHDLTVKDNYPEMKGNKILIDFFISYINSSIFQTLNGNITPVFKDFEYSEEGFRDYIGDEKRNDKYFKVVPGWRCKNLLAAIYLKFYFIVTEIQDISRCKSCNQIHTRREIYCSDKCKRDDFKNRRKEAFKLWEKGFSPKEIHVKLNEDSGLETIKGWIDKWSTAKNKAHSLYKNACTAKAIYKEIKGTDREILLLSVIRNWYEEWSDN